MMPMTTAVAKGFQRFSVSRCARPVLRGGRVAIGVLSLRAWWTVSQMAIAEMIATKTQGLMPVLACRLPLSRVIPRMPSVKPARGPSFMIAEKSA